MRTPENSPGSPAQCPAVTTTLGAMSVPEQRQVGTPFSSITMSTAAGCALPSTEPFVINGAVVGANGAVGALSQPSASRQTAARVGMNFRIVVDLPSGEWNSPTAGHHWSP